MREGYVYRIIAPGSNSVYVGQSYDPHKRFKQHKRFRGDNPKLSNWLKKHTDAEIYFWPVIDMDAEEIADEAECRRLGYDLLNLIPCGSIPPNSKGRKYTPEVVASKTAARWTPEACARQSAVMTGRTHTPETLTKMSKASPRRRHTPEDKARQSAVMTGRKQTPEHISKKSEAVRGRHFTKLSAAKKDKPWSPARRAAHERKKDRG
jgi:predicted GIY-YIG superfamily endonuclease